MTLPAAPLDNISNSLSLLKPTYQLLPTRICGLAVLKKLIPARFPAVMGFMLVYPLRVVLFVKVLTPVKDWVADSWAAVASLPDMVDMLPDMVDMLPDIEVILVAKLL